MIDWLCHDAPDLFVRSGVRISGLSEGDVSNSLQRLKRKGVVKFVRRLGKWRNYITVRRDR